MFLHYVSSSFSARSAAILLRWSRTFPFPGGGCQFSAAWKQTHSLEQKKGKWAETVTGSDLLPTFCGCGENLVPEEVPQLSRQVAQEAE